jgi:hypothetical protein
MILLFRGLLHANARLARGRKQQDATPGDNLMPAQHGKEGGFPRSGGTDENRGP